MHWITQDKVHLDRVASAWLIKRFIDSEAEFGFIMPEDLKRQEREALGELPPSYILFAFPGSELGPHDKDGSAFRKLLVKYNLTDAALQMLSLLIEAGIYHYYHHGDSDYSAADLKYPEGVGLEAISLGMIYVAECDDDIVAFSMILYDALYAWCRGRILEAGRPELAKLPMRERREAVKNIIVNGARVGQVSGRV